MFRYNYRSFEAHGLPVASFAVLGDASRRWRPERYGWSLWGFEMTLRFPVVKLIDWKGREEELLASRNPFALITQAFLSTRARRRKLSIAGDGASSTPGPSKRSSPKAITRACGCGRVAASQVRRSAATVGRGSLQESSLLRRQRDVNRGCAACCPRRPAVSPSAAASARAGRCVRVARALLRARRDAFRAIGTVCARRKACARDSLAFCSAEGLDRKRSEALRAQKACIAAKGSPCVRRSFRSDRARRSARAEGVSPADPWPQPPRADLFGVSRRSCGRRRSCGSLGC